MRCSSSQPSGSEGWGDCSSTLAPISRAGNPHAEGFYVACAFHTTGAVETRFGGGLAMQRAL